MIVVAITASSVDIMGKLLRSGLADRTNEEGPVLTLLGAIRTDSGNPHLRKTAWWGWEDSNFLTLSWFENEKTRRSGPSLL